MLKDSAGILFQCWNVRHPQKNCLFTLLNDMATSFLFRVKFTGIYYFQSHRPKKNKVLTGRKSKDRTFLLTNLDFIRFKKKKKKALNNLPPPLSKRKRNPQNHIIAMNSQITSEARIILLVHNKSYILFSIYSPHHPTPLHTHKHNHSYYVPSSHIPSKKKNVRKEKASCHKNYMLDGSRGLGKSSDSLDSNFAHLETMVQHLGCSEGKKV